MEETIKDPESGNVVRFTDNGMKEGDLNGIDPMGLSWEEIQDKLDAMIEGDK